MVGEWSCQCSGGSPAAVCLGCGEILAFRSCQAPLAAVAFEGSCARPSSFRRKPESSVPANGDASCISSGTSMDKSCAKDPEGRHTSALPCRGVLVFAEKPYCGKARQGPNWNAKAA